MAQLSSSQLLWRGRIEAGLRLVAPALDLVLVAGDRLSRTVDRDEPELIMPSRLRTDDQRSLADGR